MSVRFDSPSDSYTATTGNPTGSTWSATCWLMLRADRNDYQVFLTFRVGSGGDTVWLETNADGTSLRIDGADGIPARDLTVDTWYRVGLVVQGVTGTIYSGTDAGALTSSTGSLGVAITPTQFQVANDQNGGWANCRLAALKVWNAALSQAEITAELTQFAPLRTAGLLRYHPFQTAPGTADSSGLGNNLTAGSSATTTEADPPIPVTSATAPTVGAGADASSNLGATFSRIATENNGGATITTRAWTVLSGPAGVGTTIGTAAALSWTPTTPGDYVLRYAATNSVGTGTDDVAVTVVPPPSGFLLFF